MKKRNLGIVLSYLKTFLNMIAGLFMSSFLLRQLGDTEYGVYQTISSFANYLVLLEFGTGTVIVKNLSVSRAKGESKLQNEKNIATIWGIANGLAAAIAIVSCVFYCLIDTVYASSLTAVQIAASKKMFIFITIYLLASYFSQTLDGIILAFEHYTYASIVAIIRAIVRFIVVVVAILNYKQAIVLAIIDAAIAIVQTTVGYMYCRYKLRVRVGFVGFDKVIFKTSLPLCLALFLQTVVNQANNTVGKFVLGILSTPENVSLYSVALYLFSLFSSLTTIPLSMYSPQIIKDVVAGLEGEELTKTLVQPSRLVVIIGGAILFGFIAAGKPFLVIFYGEQYLTAWIMAIVLMTPMFINMTSSVVISVLDAKNKRLTRSIILMISTTLNIVLSIWLINRVGIMGAAVATGVATLLQTVTTSIYYSRFISIKMCYLYTNVYKGVLVYQLLGAVIGYCISSNLSHSFVALIAGGCTYVLIAFGGFLLFGKNDAEAKMLRNLTGKLLRKQKS